MYTSNSTMNAIGARAVYHYDNNNTQQKNSCPVINNKEKTSVLYMLNPHSHNIKDHWPVLFLCLTGH